MSGQSSSDGKRQKVIYKERIYRPAIYLRDKLTYIGMYMLKNYSKPIIYALLLFLPGVIFFAMTNPKELPVAFYIVPFVYIYLCGYVVTRFLLIKLGSHRYLHLIPNVIAGLITLILLLGSLQQLSLRDIILLICIGVLLGWYLFKLGPKTS